MLKYFKSAFWVRQPVPLLGDLPVHVLALVPFVVLGLLHPGFWLMGLGLGAGFLTMLAMSPRFQRITDLPSALEK